jgi:phosphotransferase system HPr-like phosphotransfer protein
MKKELEEAANIWITKNSGITVCITAENENDALMEIMEYFDENGTSDLRLEEEVEDE